MAKPWGLSAVLLFTSLPGTARADDAGAPHAAPSTAAAPASQGVNQTRKAEWGGLYDGRTLGSGGGAVTVEGGWPGIGAGVLLGIASPVDLGVKAEGHFAGLGTYETDNMTLNYGMDILAVLRVGMVQSDTVSFLVRVEPGFRFSQFSPQLAGGPVIDIAADVGIHVTKGGSVYAGLEVPLFFGLVNYVDVLTQIPILPGGGFEYHVNHFIGFGGRFSAGPSIATGGGLTTTSFAFIGQGFFVFRWDRVG